MNKCDIQIKPVGQEAISSIQHLSNAIWPTTYQDILSKSQSEYMLYMMYSADSLKEQMEKGCQFLIIYEKGREVGFAAYQIIDSFAKLHKIYLLAECQGKGYGKAMIADIVMRLKTHKIHNLTLNVNRSNNAKIAYEKMGFIVEKEEDIEIGNGYFMNDFRMRLDF